MKAHVCFSHSYIKDIEVDFPVIPRKGEAITFGPGMVKYGNGTEADLNSYRVKSVEYFITPDLQTRVVVNVGLD